MRQHQVFVSILALFVAQLAASCGDPSEAPRVELPVVVDASSMGLTTNDLGYQIDVTSARIAINNLVFTVAGEVHTASLWQTISDALVPVAHAHPGHSQGGEVTGELPGNFVIDWPGDDGNEIGLATLIASNYSAANFTFGHGTAQALGLDDPLVGHTAVFTGTASKNGTTWSFTIIVDSPQNRALIGVPFEAAIDADMTGTLYLRFKTIDELEGDTLFDTIDFAALDADADGEVLIAPDVAEAEDAYNTFRRAFQTHDHYSIHFAQESP